MEDLEQKIVEAKSIEDPVARKKAIRKLRRQLRSKSDSPAVALKEKKPEQTREQLLEQLEASPLEKITGWVMAKGVGGEYKKYERGYGYGINLSVKEGATADDMIEKFRERWGEDPKWYYFNPEDTDHQNLLVLLGPLPSHTP